MMGAHLTPATTVAQICRNRGKSEGFQEAASGKSQTWGRFSGDDLLDNLRQRCGSGMSSDR